MAKKKSANRFRVNPGGGKQWNPGHDDLGSDTAASADEVKAYDKIVDENEKALQDYEKGLIDYQTANKERLDAIRKHARSSGITLEEQKNLLNKSTEELNAKAKELGKPVPLEKSKNQTSDYQGYAKLFDELGPGLGKRAYQGARVMRYLDTINKAGGLSGIGKKIGKLVGSGGGEEEAEAGGGGGGKPPTVYPKGGSPKDVPGGKPLEAKPTEASKSPSPSIPGGKSLDLAGKGGGGGGGGAGKALSGASEAAGAGEAAGAAEAVGGAAMGAEIAAIAGPIGAVVAIADMAATEIADNINAFGKKIEVAGNIAVKIAGNDGFGAVAEAGESAAKGIEEHGMAGKVAAAEIRLVTTTLTTFKKVLDSFADRGKQIAGYDANIAKASANSDVSKVYADIRESQALSKEYSALIKSQTQIETNIQDALTPIKQNLMRMLIPIAAGVEIITANLANTFKVLGDIQNGVQDGITAVWQIAEKTPMIGDAIKALHKSFNDARKPKGVVEPQLAFDALMDVRGKVSIDKTPTPNPPMTNTANNGLNFPLLGM